MHFDDDKISIYNNCENKGGCCLWIPGIKDCMEVNI